MTEQDIQKELDKINELSHIELAKLWRFAPSDHIYIQNKTLYEAFRSRLWDHFGGINVNVSKYVGWDQP